MNMKMFLRVGYAPAMFFALMAAPIAHAAPVISLGDAESYSVLTGTQVTNSGPTTISGNLGTDPAGGGAPTNFPPGVVGPPGTIQTWTTSAHNAQLAQKAVFDTNIAAPAQPCTAGFTAMAPSLNGLTLDPGVYCTPANFTLSGTLTLNGTGSPATDVWIFRNGAASDLIVSSGSAAKVVFTGTGGNACNVWWRIGRTATFDGANVMVGNILAGTSITFGTGATLDGRAFAYTAEVTLLSNTISGPTCVAAVVPTPSYGHEVAPLISVKKVPTPLSLPAGPGSVTYDYTVINPGTITLTDVTLKDDKCSNISRISGDVNGNGWLETTETWKYRCSTVLSSTTVNYATARGLGNGLAAVDTAIAQVFVGVRVVPPLIHVVKTPSPLDLPSAGGSVTYSYAVSNPGTVALTGVTVTDDKCSNISRVSGDVNGDSKLQSNETWQYTCTMNLTQTMTNTAIATGHANGLTAIDTALATVIVAGLPVPPLIHIIKMPEPVVLPSGGGWVTYTYTVSNPGTVLLNNVSVSDDKCGPVTMVSGDTNGNGMMGPTESWTFTCRKYLEYTTMNTATAQGSANGLTVKDVAVANVPVSPALVPVAPTLPNTGFEPSNGMAGWVAAFAAIFVSATLVLAVTKRKSIF